MPQAHQNPYVGPSAFKDGDLLYGRNREKVRILDVLMAQRIVLLYSPSGAGKTSLIQAALIPALREEGFLVLPIIRVGSNLDLEQEVSSKTNPYVLSTLLSLEESTEQKRSVTELVHLDLASYLEQRLPENREMDEQVLIFDQFEEILTINPFDLGTKKDFFIQLGKALHARNYWALFAMREEFLAGLDPYLHLLPTQLKTTFRLELLSREAASRAIQKPAQNAKLPFTHEAVKALVEDLSRVWVQQIGGSHEQTLGKYVEPVQLQVVCYQLWERLPSEIERISEEHVKELADVDKALARYYADRIGNASQKTGESERNIRKWFESQLITEQGLRGQVLKGAEQSQGLNNEMIELLEAAYLVRAEERLNATWFELAHDRLIEPIRGNNAEWFQENLSTLQRQADIWNREGRADSFLLRGEALKEAERWAATIVEPLSTHDEEFLKRSQRAQAVSEEKQKQAQRIRRLAIVASVVSMVALMAFGVAFYFFLQSRQAEKVALKAKDEAEERRKDAERLRDISLAQALSAQALSRPDETGALLAQQAYLLNQQIQGPILAQVDQALRTVLNAPYFAHTLYGQNSRVLSLAFSPKERILAAGCRDGSIWLWRPGRSDIDPVRLSDRTDRGHTEGVFSLAFGPEGNTLASGSDDGTLRLWNLSQPDRDPIVFEKHSGGILSIAFSPNGKTLVSGGNFGKIALWNVSRPSDPILLDAHPRYISSLAFSPNGDTLASASGDGTILIWDPAHPEAAPVSLGTHSKEAITAIAFSPDGEILASGGGDKSIRLWDVRSRTELTALTGHTAGISSLAFSSDGKLASSAYDSTVRLWNWHDSNSDSIILPAYGSQTDSIAFSADGRALAANALDNSTIRVWELQESTEIFNVLHAHNARVNSIAFSSDGKMLASGSGESGAEDNTLRLWRLDRPEKEASILGSYADRITTVAISKDGRMLASGGEDALIRIWDLQNPENAPVTLAECHLDSINSLAFSPDGKRLASGSDDTTIYLWDLEARRDLDDCERRPIPFWNQESLNVYSVAFSPDGKTLASGGKIVKGIEGGAVVSLWNTNNPDADPIRLPHEGQVNSVTFSPDGKILASGGTDQIVRLWNLENLDRITSSPLHGHKGSVMSVAFSPEGKILASGSNDRTVRLWDLENLDNDPLVLHDPEGTVLSIAFSEDGRILASSSDNGSIFLHIADTKRLVKKVCQKVWRNLTEDEWEQFTGRDISYQPVCPELIRK